MKYFVTLFLLIAFSFYLPAQTIVSAELQAAGLTCSMCSNAIQKALKSIPFVEEVEPDLKNSSFLIQFKDHPNVMIQAVRNAVEDAGFSIASLKMKIKNEAGSLSKVQPVLIGRQFICIADIELESWKDQSMIEVLIIDRHFLTEKKWKQYQKLITQSQCVQPAPANGFMYHAVVIK
ncbi:MAG: heavy-metal-associated domain-containing protein [Bacteroidota bacterium]|jgi:copper chaperone CopZ